MKALTSSFTIPKKVNFSHLITLFCVFFVLFAPEKWQNIISILGILSFGILHGANDLKILSKKVTHKSSFLGIPFWVIYIGVVLLGISIFYFIPGMALLTFVLVSCYHFGEQHWHKKLEMRKGHSLFFSIYGALIFLMLFNFHYNEVADVIFQISSVQIPYNFFWISLLICACLFFVLTGFNFKSYKQFLEEWMLLGLLALLFCKGTLLFGFGLYFVLWHSLPSLSSQVNYLYEKKTSKSYKEYFKSAFFYWILALVGLIVFYFFGVLPKNQYLSVFFSFLAAITFPHIVVMGLMFESHKNP